MAYIYGLHWSCRNGEQYDDEEAARIALSSYIDQKLASLRDRSDDKAKARKNWRKILPEYTGQTLSEPTDCLLAISGIAETYAEILNNEYLAGIWLGDLLAALMWENISEKFPRRPEYFAPSWSWASIDGHVEDFGDLNPKDPNLDVVGYNIQLREPKAPFGAVLSGHLILKGLSRRLRWDGWSLFILS
jgi:nitrogen fixation-related uncharacterized protein